MTPPPHPIPVIPHSPSSLVVKKLNLPTVHEEQIVNYQAANQAVNGFQSLANTKELVVWTDTAQNILPDLPENAHLPLSVLAYGTLKKFLLKEGNRVRIIQQHVTINELGKTLIEWTLQKEEMSFRSPSTVLAGKYQLGPVLRQTNQALIREAFDIQFSTPVIIKQIALATLKSEQLIEKEESGRSFFVPKEQVIMDILRSNPHPHIVQYTEAISNLEESTLKFEESETETKFCFLVLKPLSSKSVDLFDLIESESYLDEHVIRYLFCQLVDALAHLHNMGIVHRDIKDENVVVDPEAMQCQLIDFGSAALIKEGPFTSFFGTLDYAAPELLTPLADRPCISLISPYPGPPQDIWSMGILLYTMTYKEVPFRNVAEITRAKLDPGRMPFQRDRQLDLINSMLNTDPLQRPTIEKIKQHPWLLLQH